MSNRSYEEDIQYWTGWIDDADSEYEFRSDDVMLSHLTDQEILGLGDSYDDPRIDALARNYIELRRKLQEPL